MAHSVGANPLTGKGYYQGKLNLYIKTRYSLDEIKDMGYESYDDFIVANRSNITMDGNGNIEINGRSAEGYSKVMPGDGSGKYHSKLYITKRVVKNLDSWGIGTIEHENLHSIRHWTGEFYEDVNLWGIDGALTVDETLAYIRGVQFGGASYLNHVSSYGYMQSYITKYYDMFHLDNSINIMNY